MQSEYTILLSTTTDLTVNGKAFVKNTTLQKIACWLQIEWQRNLFQSIPFERINLAPKARSMF